MIAWKKWLLALCCVLMAGSDAAAQNDGDWIDRLAVEKDWVRWIDAVGRPETVTKLYIKNREPLDTLVLNTFHNLTGLIIVDSPLPDLDFLKNFTDLTVFECQGNKLRSLEGIQHLKKATEISIKSNFITDVSPLDSLTQLKMLNLYENDIANISPISHLRNITHLDLSKNQIRNIDALEGWDQLQYLSVYSCYNLQNIDPIANIRKVKHLNISFLDISDFSLHLLDSLTQLENLRIQGMVHSNEEVKLLGKHTTLIGLTMGRNDNVSDISPLHTLEKLEYLDIHSNDVSDISVTSNFPRLVKLVMYRNHVTDLRPLEECLELRALFMFENPIEDYEIVYQLLKLQHLHVTKADFTKESAGELKTRLPKTKIVFM